MTRKSNPLRAFLEDRLLPGEAPQHPEKDSYQMEMARVQTNLLKKKFGSSKACWKKIQTRVKRCKSLALFLECAVRSRDYAEFDQFAVNPIMFTFSTAEEVQGEEAFKRLLFSGDLPVRKKRCLAIYLLWLCQRHGLFSLTNVDLWNVDTPVMRNGRASATLLESGPAGLLSHWTEDEMRVFVHMQKLYKSWLPQESREVLQIPGLLPHTLAALQKIKAEEVKDEDDNDVTTVIVNVLKNEPAPVPVLKVISLMFGVFGLKAGLQKRGAFLYEDELINSLAMASACEGVLSSERLYVIDSVRTLFKGKDYISPMVEAYQSSNQDTQGIERIIDGAVTGYSNAVCQVPQLLFHPQLVAHLQRGNSSPTASPESAALMAPDSAALMDDSPGYSPAAPLEPSPWTGNSPGVSPAVIPEPAILPVPPTLPVPTDLHNTPTAASPESSPWQDNFLGRPAASPGHLDPDEVIGWLENALIAVNRCKLALEHHIQYATARIEATTAINEKANEAGSHADEHQVDEHQVDDPQQTICQRTHEAGLEREAPSPRRRAASPGERARKRHKRTSKRQYIYFL